MLRLLLGSDVSSPGAEAQQRGWACPAHLYDFAARVRSALVTQLRAPKGYYPSRKEPPQSESQPADESA
jgi:hypothetical protein